MNRSPSIFFALAAVAALALQACEDAARPLSPSPMMSGASAEPAPLVPRIIAPQTTDPAIDWIPAVNPQFNHHYVWLDPSRESNGKLFVFMTGTGGVPRGVQLVQQEAARLGYYVIGLMYQNDVSLNGPCIPSPDPLCPGNIGLEITDGIDRSGFVDVSPANGIDNRLAKLLLYLDAQYPNERWSGFLKNGAPKWSRIAVGGQSQGAQHAALIGKIRRVQRVVMFAGPPARVPEEADAWVVASGNTPVAKYFALLHQRDARFARILANLNALNLGRFGDPVAPELSEPPYDGTHVLITDLEPTGGYGGDNPHRSPAADAITPRGPDGTPLLRDAWRYMLGDRGGLEDDAESGGGL